MAGSMNLNWLGALATGILVVAVTIGVTLTVLDDFADKANVSGNSASYNAYVDLKTEVIDLITWVGLIILVIIAAIILMYVRGFAGQAR